MALTKTPIRQVKVLLQKDFGLNPSLDAVRKHLKRCFDQGLVTREKFGRSYYYKISVKSRDRLLIIRARREKKFEKGRRLDSFTVIRGKQAE